MFANCYTPLTSSQGFPNILRKEKLCFSCCVPGQSVGNKNLAVVLNYAPTSAVALPGNLQKFFLPLSLYWRTSFSQCLPFRTGHPHHERQDRNSVLSHNESSMARTLTVWEDSQYTNSNQFIDHHIFPSLRELNDNIVSLRTFKTDMWSKTQTSGSSLWLLIHCTESMSKERATTGELDKTVKRGGREGIDLQLT